MFKSWCASQKFNNASNLSHVLLDGGKLSVPFDKLDNFYEKYVEAVKRGDRLYVVEQKTENYNFFVDIDYKNSEALNLDEIKDICKIICDKVKRHGGRDCIISVAPPKPHGDLIKTGIHLNWYGLVVDQASAVALREHIIITLTRAKGGVNWNEVVDASVYGSVTRKTMGSGFRMPWSYKKAKHTACNGQGGSECIGGKIDQLAYLPVFKYVHGPLSSIIRIVQEASVENLRMIVVRTDAPQNTIIESPSSKLREGTFTVTQTKDELMDEQVKCEIETFIQKNLEGQQNASVTKVFKHGNCFLVSTNSKYCENLKREHGSNHVWFIISGKEIVQKCFCTCETLVGRRDGFCKDFCGRRHILPKPLIDKLYTDIKNCLEIKKRIEKPQVNQSDAKPLIETFIRKNMNAPGDLQVISIVKVKNKHIALTTSTYCETICGLHESCVMSYIIDGTKIVQKCPKCKKNTARTHCLDIKIIKVLKQ
jgi:hypothetical protein